MAGHFFPLPKIFRLALLSSLVLLATPTLADGQYARCAWNVFALAPKLFFKPVVEQVLASLSFACSQGPSAAISASADPPPFPAYKLN